MHLRLVTPLIAALIVAGLVGEGERFALLGPNAVVAGELDLIGYTKLQEQLGDSLPTGVGIEVSHVEVSTSDALTYTPQTDGDYAAEFSGKEFDHISGASTPLTHATRVGSRFYGNTLSVAPGISSIANYSATKGSTAGWFYGEFLHARSRQLPEITPTRIFNHSWVFDAGNFHNPDALYRIDWLAETDDIIQVAGVPNTDTVDGPYPLFASLFNAIAVGITNGEHITGAPEPTSSGTGPYYAESRMRPHLVGPTTVTSFAAPLVAGTAAMLLETAQTRSWLSNGTTPSSVGRRNLTLQHGETSEVVRSLLMAGADRKAAFQVSGSAHAYQATTDSGLDSTFGAGELDVFNSYHILAAGEQDSVEAGGSGQIKLYGFDYESEITPRITKTYLFSVDAVEREFVASLNWNLAIGLNLSGFRYEGTPELSLGKIPNLDLKLVNITEGGSQLVAESKGTLDTTENLYVSNLPAGDYKLQVSYGSSQVSSIDYGLAWRFAPSNDPLSGDVNLDGQVSLLDLAIVQSNFGKTERLIWTDGDLDGNGLVDRADLQLILSHYGKSTLPVTPPTESNSPSQVPEPSSLALIMLSLFCTGLSRRRWSRHAR